MKILDITYIVGILVTQSRGCTLLPPTYSGALNHVHSAYQNGSLRPYYRVEVFGCSAIYIKMGNFERFYNTDGLPSH